MVHFKTHDVLGLCAMLLLGCGESSPSTGNADRLAGGGTSGAATGGAKSSGTAGSMVVASGGASAGATTVSAFGGSSAGEGGVASGGTRASGGSGVGGTATAGAATGGNATGGTSIAGGATGGGANGGAATGGAATGGTSTGAIAGSAGSNDAVAGNGNVGGSAGAAGTPANQAGSAGAGPFGECLPSSIAKPNVVVLKDAAPTGADVEGRLWVGGNLVLSGGYSVNAANATTTSCSEYGLVVGGNITGDPIVPAGRAAYGGTCNGSWSGTCGIYHTTPVDFAALDQQMKNYSAALKTLVPEGTTSVAGSYLTLTGSSASLNVFSLSASDLAAYGLKIAVPTGSSVLVNVSGATVNWTGKSFAFPDGNGTCKSGTSTWCHRILYNFYDATTLLASGIGIQGSVLAPYATLDGSGGIVDGQVIVNNLKGGLEYHSYMFTGCLQP